MVGSSMHQRCLVLAVAFQWVVQVLSILRHGKNMPRRWLTIVPWSGGEQYTFGCPFWVFFPRPGQRHILTKVDSYIQIFLFHEDWEGGTTQGIHPADSAPLEGLWILLVSELLTKTLRRAINAWKGCRSFENGLRKNRSCSKCYTIDCFGTCFTRAQTCDNVRVQSATQSTASVHALHVPKPVITFVFKVLHNRLLR